MMFLIKLFTWTGILANAIGSIALLRDFRDMVPLPIVRVGRQAEIVSACSVGTAAGQALGNAMARKFQHCWDKWLGCELGIAQF